MKKEVQIVAKRLKEARGRMTQMEVSKTLKLSQAVLSKMESGLREPTAAELNMFAKLYNKPISYFFEDAKAPVTDILKNFFKKKCSSLNIDMVFLYGSFARGLPKESSDIDIGIVFKGQPSKIKTFDIISEISLALSYELKKEVNIISIDSDNWKPMLYYNIIVLGVPVFVSDEDKYQALRWKAISQMEDFVTMGIAWQIAAAQASLRRLEHG